MILTMVLQGHPLAKNVKNKQTKGGKKMSAFDFDVTELLRT